MAACNETLSQEIPLPNNWTVYATGEGRKVFIDHANKVTTWTDPRDSLTKPQTFADCIGDELPYGWEMAHDRDLGDYFIDHNRGINQLEDPREQWRVMQESMIRYYLSSAKESIEAKEKILSLKQERSVLANQELAYLMSILQRIHERQSHSSLPSSTFGSKNSLATASSSCSLYSKYDPDLLKAEIEVAKQRLTRLKFEEQCARRELSHKQKGVSTLARIKQSISDRPQGYTLAEKKLLENELKDLKKVLVAIETEKQMLMEQVKELCNDLQSDNAKSDSQLEFPIDKASCSSQTDIVEPAIVNRVAALARARLRYNELKSLLYSSHQQLAVLNEKMLPADLELNLDQINLINEKEQLLRELKSVCCHTNGNKFTTCSNEGSSGDLVESTSRQRLKLTEKMHELEEDLRRALRLTEEQMAQRSHLLDQKEDIECKIRETGHALASLEQQLKALSTSTLSTSSLSTSSASCTSLTSSCGGGVVDRCGAFSGIARFSSKAVDEVRRRVERSLGLASSATTADVGSPSAAPLNSAFDLVVHRENSVGSSGADTGGNRSISAAVSDESMAGDSGVFDGALRRATNSCASAALDDATPSSSSPQVMLTLSFDAASGKLHTTVEKARNLSRLWNGGKSEPNAAAEKYLGTNGFATDTNDSPKSTMQSSSQCGANRNQSIRDCDDWSESPHRPIAANGVASSLVDDVTAAQVRVRLLPPDGQADLTEFRTDWADISDAGCTANRMQNANAASKPVVVAFDRSYETRISLRSLCDKTLQLYVFVRRAHSADCVGEAQLSLADFSGGTTTRSRWVNVLGSQFFVAPPSEPLAASTAAAAIASSASRGAAASASLSPSDDAWRLDRQTTLLARHLNTLKEESSDESTVIPSQTSTLTRSRAANAANLDEISCYSISSGDGVSCCSISYVLPSISTPQSTSGCLRLTVNDDSMPQGESSNDGQLIRTFEKETNTDHPINRDESSCSTHDGGQKFDQGQCTSCSPSELTPSFSRRLNRSDSDTSVALFRREPFKRNVMERRSLRWKKVSNSRFSKKVGAANCTDMESKTIKNRVDRFRTSIDIDLDLQAAKIRLNRKKEDLETLKSLKSQLESCKSSDKTEFPLDVLSNDLLLPLLNPHSKLINKVTSVICNDDSEVHPNSIKAKNFRSEEKRVQHFIRKAARQVRKLNETKQQFPSASHFCKKISSIVSTPTGMINVINVNADD